MHGQKNGPERVTALPKPLCLTLNMTAARLSVALLAASAWAAVPAPFSGKLTVYMNGNTVAHETYSITPGDGAIVLDGSGHAELGTMKVDIAQFRVVMDDKYQPRDAAAKASLGQIAMAVQVTFADGKAKVQMQTGQNSQTKETDVHPDALVVNSNLPLYPWAILARRADLKATAPQQFHAYIIGQKEIPLTVTCKGKSTVEFANKTAELSQITASMETSEGKTIDLNLWIDADRNLIKMSVPAQNVEVYQEAWEPKAAAAPATPETPPAPSQQTPPAPQLPPAQKP